MKTILALKNFGFDGKHVEPGTTMTVNPDDFGGTYQDFITAGLFEEVAEEAPSKPSKKAVSATVTVLESDGTTETSPIPVADIPQG